MVSSVHVLLCFLASVGLYLLDMMHYECISFVICAAIFCLLFVVYRNDDEELNIAEPPCNDNDSVASCGSTSSQRWSSDMDFDEQSDDGDNVQVEGDTGIVVENYVMTETEQSKMSQQASDEAVTESNVLCPVLSCLSPSKVVGNSTDVLDTDVHTKQRSEPQNSVDQRASSEDEEPGATSFKGHTRIEAVTSLEDCNHERQPPSSSFTEPDKPNGANSMISQSGKLEPAAKATKVMSCSTSKTLNVKCQEKSVLNEVKVASGITSNSQLDAPTSYSLSPRMSVKCSTKGITPNDGNIKTMVPIQRSISAGSGTHPILHGAHSQTGVLPVVHPVNPWPRDTNHSRPRSYNTNDVTSQDQNKNSKSSQEQQLSQVPTHLDVADNVDSYRRKNLFEKPLAGPHLEMKPALLPNPPSFQQHNVRPDETTRNSYVAGDGRTGLLPTPHGPSPLSINSSCTMWRLPSSKGNTPATTPPRNVEGRYVNQEVCLIFSP